MTEFKQKWVCKIRDTLAAAGAWLHLTNHWTPLLPHNNNVSLMEAFSKLNFSHSNLAQLIVVGFFYK